MFGTKRWTLRHWHGAAEGPLARDRRGRSPIIVGRGGHVPHRAHPHVSPLREGGAEEVRTLARKAFMACPWAGIGRNGPGSSVIVA